MNLNELKELAVAHKNAENAYEKAFSNWCDSRKGIEMPRFWELMNVYSVLVMYALKRQNTSEWAADEFFRKAGTQQYYHFGSKLPVPEYTVNEAIDFACVYADVRKTFSSVIDNWCIEMNRGDDAYGDLMDNLPLLGEGFFDVIRKETPYDDVEEFEEFVKKSCKGKVAEEFAKFILHGENYNRTALSDAAQKWFAIEALTEIPDELPGQTLPDVSEQVIEFFEKFPSGNPLDHAIATAFDNYDQQLVSNYITLEVDELSGQTIPFDRKGFDSMLKGVLKHFGKACSVQTVLTTYKQVM